MTEVGEMAEAHAVGTAGEPYAWDGDESDEDEDYRALLDRLRERVPCLLTGEAFEVFTAVAPEGWRVELLEGVIHLWPLMDGNHAVILARIADQVADQRRGLNCYRRLGLLLPAGPVPGEPEPAAGRAEPDIVVAHRRSFCNEDLYQDPAAVLLVGEVTSAATAFNDRVRKSRCYARAGIPVYLLIDRDARHIVLCTEPSGPTGGDDDYRSKATYKFGETIPLPEPLGFDLDTAEFP
ncbi:Uma2 family endonuclease [Streptomyces sp. NPDC047097]|uniref:Uma2 family endonuclease n=1 Tax=Streptomyces sp. NPDC047097 TaxID=3155260 RepID=UPI0033F153EF